MFIESEKAAWLRVWHAYCQTLKTQRQPGQQTVVHVHASIYLQSWKYCILKLLVYTHALANTTTGCSGSVTKAHK